MFGRAAHHTAASGARQVADTTVAGLRETPAEGEAVPAGLSANDVGGDVMKKNMGTADRVIRILAALAIAALYLTGNVSGIAAIVLAVIALVFAVTSIVGFCPGYVPLGFSTRKKAPHAVDV